LADYPDLPVTNFITVDGKTITLKDGLDLSGKDLNGIEIHCNLGVLKNINFNDCNLENANLDETYFENCSFHRCNLFHAFITGKNIHCDFTDAIIENTSLTSPPLGITFEQLKSTKSYKDGRLLNIGLYLTCLDGQVDFSNMNLTGCYSCKGGTYNHCKIDDLNTFILKYNSLKRTGQISPRGQSDQCVINITDSVITDCNFRDFKGITFENVKSTWNYKHGRMEGIKLPEEIQKLLDAEKEKQVRPNINAK
jgi:uncharacterized protein YjbI with pentapeptide repeats